MVATRGAARRRGGYAALVLAPTLALAACAPAQAGQEGGPVCNRPEVLDAVAADLAARGSTAEVERGAAGEVPGGRSGLVLCAVHLRWRFFDTNRFGYQPLHSYTVHRYSVRAGRNGYFVGDEDG